MLLSHYYYSRLHRRRETAKTNEMLGSVAMTDKKEFKAVFDLQRDPVKIEPYYDNWATDYDNDVKRKDYVAPRRITELTLEFGKFGAESTLLDAGCGTGLIGLTLNSAQFAGQLTGVDLSQEMIEEARKTNAYTHLFGQVDLNISIAQQIDQSEFDVCVCGGVFTPGHVPPSALNRLIDATRTGGLIVLSARKKFCDETQFEQFIQHQSEQRLVEINHLEHSVYIGYDQALYAVLTVL